MNFRVLIALVTVASLSCGPAQVSSDELARRAWLGLDGVLTKSLTLGFAGFNAASSANIPPQMTTGDDGGTLTISGQVDQGNSANKGMRLRVATTDYTDGAFTPDGGMPMQVRYSTAADALPSLDLQLRGIPDGTFSGSLKGGFSMKGDLTGTVQLDVSVAGPLENDGSGKPRRKAGATMVTGTATSGAGTFQISVTR
jgi:hypothetical protein